MKINGIYKLKYMQDTWSFVGLLRNEKKFNLHDEVFFSMNNHEISKGKIVGVELPPTENPEYRYKVQLEERLVENAAEEHDICIYMDNNLDRITISCDHIFNTPEEAKESAIKNLEICYKLQKEEIEKYFNPFIKK